MGESTRYHRGCRRRDCGWIGSREEGGKIAQELFFDDSERAIFVAVRVKWRFTDAELQLDSVGGSVSGTVDSQPLGWLRELVVRTRSAVIRFPLRSLRPRSTLLHGTWIQPLCSFAMACDDCHFVGVITGQMGVDEDQQICNSL